MFYSGRLRPYLQTLDEAGKACQGETLKLNTETLKYARNKFYDTGPRFHILSSKTECFQPNPMFG